MPAPVRPSPPPQQAGQLNRGAARRPVRKLAGVVTEQRRGMAAEADLWIVFAPVKGAAMETIVQKATELGASRLLPIVTQRTEVRSPSPRRLPEGQGLTGERRRRGISKARGCRQS
jgi:hypothetical protein